MDKRRQALEARQDELHMEFLMDDYAAELGAQVRREAEQAYANGEITFPPELDESIRKMIENAPEPGKPQKPVRNALRYGLVAAVTALLLFGALIAVQAAGIDVFGRIASWTNSVFRFRDDTESAAEEETDVSENAIQTALRENGLPVELAPTWLPEGYELSGIKATKADTVVLIDAYAECIGKPPIYISIVHDENQIVYDDFLWEKESQGAQSFALNNRIFYLFENEGSWTGAWTDGNNSVSFFGFESIDQLKTIIDSMGEAK